jgi:hypothetical protein
MPPFSSLRFDNLTDREDENAEGHQTRGRRRPAGLRPNSSEFFDVISEWFIRI